MKKIVKKILIILLTVIAVLVIGLLINNFIVGSYYKKLDTNNDSLSSSEIEAVENVYNKLANQTQETIPGLNISIDVIIFNSDYEFMFSSEEATGAWEFIKHIDSLDRDLYRRDASNPQAFTTYIVDRWLGSMSTLNYLNKDIISELPFFMPPQIYVTDEDYYEAVIIHEMSHAVQGNSNNERITKDSHLHNICAEFRENSKFNDYIGNEAKYLQLAVDADSNEDILKYVKLFLQTRDERRSQSGMQFDDIVQEKELEWLEGTARYVEYNFAQDSDSLIAKGLDDIEQKMKQTVDDRYYTSGMAQAIILDKLSPEWKQKLYNDDFYYEEELRKFVE